MTLSGTHVWEYLFKEGCSYLIQDSISLAKKNIEKVYSEKEVNTIVFDRKTYSFLSSRFFSDFYNDVKNGTICGLKIVVDDGAFNHAFIFYSPDNTIDNMDEISVCGIVNVYF